MLMPVAFSRLKIRVSDKLPNPCFKTGATSDQIPTQLQDLRTLSL